MIVRLSGTLIEKHPSQAVVECSGVGYGVHISLSTFEKLPSIGDAVQLLTHLVVREDAHLLYGFATAQERDTFCQLLKVRGIGARLSLTLLSGLSPSELARAVDKQETTRLIKIPGIGKKTAERLLLELKDKLPLEKSPVSTPHPLGGDQIGDPNPNDARQDIEQALIALGYSEKEAQAALKTLPDGLSVSQGVRMVLGGA